MAVLEAAVKEARAILDEDEGRFTIEVRLGDGTDVSFTSQPGPATIASLKASLERSAAEAEELKPKPRRKRTRKPAAE